MQLVSQRYKLDCGVACMAMLLHTTYEDAASHFKQDFSVDDMEEEDLRKAIQECGLKMITTHTFNKEKESIVIVPSINHSGQTHAVCWTGYKVLDPNQGSTINTNVYTIPIFLGNVDKFEMQFTLQK